MFARGAVGGSGNTSLYDIIWRYLTLLDTEVLLKISKSAPSKGVSGVWRLNAMLLKMYLKCQELMNREEGQDLVEYALVIALVSIAAVASLGALAAKVVEVFTTITADL